MPDKNMIDSVSYTSGISRLQQTMLHAAHSKGRFDSDAGVSRKNQQCIRQLSVKPGQPVFQRHPSGKPGNGIPFQIVCLTSELKAAAFQSLRHRIDSFAVFVFNWAFRETAVPLFDQILQNQPLVGDAAVSSAGFEGSRRLKIQPVPSAASSSQL